MHEQGQCGRETMLGGISEHSRELEDERLGMDCLERVSIDELMTRMELKKIENDYKRLFFIYFTYRKNVIYTHLLDFCVLFH